MLARSRHEIEKIRSAYETLIRLHRDLYPLFQCDADRNYCHRDAVKRIRKMLRQYDNANPDPLSVPVSNDWRTIWDHEPTDPSDGPTYYRIFPGEYTKEEIDEIREDYTLRCRSPYDCCGQQFTWSFHVAQTPAGLVCINRTSYDY